MKRMSIIQGMLHYCRVVRAPFVRKNNAVRTTGSQNDSCDEYRTSSYFPILRTFFNY